MRGVKAIREGVAKCKKIKAKTREKEDTRKRDKEKIKEGRAAILEEMFKQVSRFLILSEMANMHFWNI